MFVYKCIDARNRAGSVITKFLVGMGFACISMWLAGAIEIVRQYDCISGMLSFEFIKHFVFIVASFSYSSEQ